MKPLVTAQEIETLIRDHDALEKGADGVFRKAPGSTLEAVTVRLHPPKGGRGDFSMPVDVDNWVRVATEAIAALVQERLAVREREVREEERERLRTAIDEVLR